MGEQPFGESAPPMTRLRLLIIVMLLLLAAVLGYIFTTPGLRPQVISIYAPPIIQPEEKTHDLGVVKTDDKVHHTFVLYNVGGKPLRIYDVETSCGCTVVDVTHKVLHPGEFTELKVTLDTSIKLGKTKKKITVKSNDPKTPELALYLTGTVIHQMMGHEKIEVKDPLVLFKGECATCHVDKGKGKVGKDLFVADCSMCHGLNGEGVKDIAPSLLTGDYNDEKVFTAVRKVIAEGSPNSPQMPPFSKAKGGPLNDDEIDSLMNFLRYQSTLAKTGQLNQQPDENAEEF